MAQEISPLHKDLGFTFRWDTIKLWQIDLPIIEMPVSEFEWYLGYPFWSELDEKMVVSPLEVKQVPELHKEQYQRTMVADLSYPINVIHLNGRWLIMDGVHRLLKANILGHDKILTKQATEKHIPLITKLA